MSESTVSYRAGALPPGPASPPIIQALQYGRDPFVFFARARARFGDVFTVRMMGETWVVVSNPAHVRQLFAQRPEDVAAGAANEALRPVLGSRNVLLLDGQEHLTRRRLILPAFRGTALNAYRAIIRNAAEIEFERWPDRGEIKALDAMERITYAVIAQIVFGSYGASPRLCEALHGLLRWTTDTRRAALFLLVGPDRLTRLPGYRRRLQAADRQLFALIKLERQRAQAGVPVRPDIVSHMTRAVADGAVDLSDQDLRDDLVTLVVAGHQTMTSVLAWALHELCQAPEWQQRLAAGDEDAALAVVRESMRLHPPVPVAGIRQLRSPMKLGEHELPAGVTVAPCTALTHRDETLYRAAATFAPERFIQARPHSSEWFPFGGGGRRCLGAAFAELEMSAVLLAVTRRYWLEPASLRSGRLGRRGVVLVPTRGAPLGVGARGETPS